LFEFGDSFSQKTCTERVQHFWVTKKRWKFNVF